MKFTNGYWLIRDGVTANYCAHAYEAETRRDADGDALVVYAPTRRVVARGDVLNGALLTLKYSSPLEDVIRVEVSHFTGGKPRLPAFALEPGLTPVGSASVEGGCAADRVLAGEGAVASPAGGVATFKSGALSVRVPLDSSSWRVEFRAGDRFLTSCDAKSTGYAEVAGNGPYIHEMLGLSLGECVYGLGERFGPFVKNGQTVDIWNQDGGTASEQAYKNIPFYLTNKGYGVFVNHPGRVSFEVASEKINRVQFSVSGEELEYFIIYGPTPKEILRKYAALTGYPALPPAWSLGLWLTTSFTTSYDEKTVTSFIDGMSERNIPLSVFHFDCFWMREYNWCDFRWDPRTFSDPAAMLARLKRRGIRVCVWINPYIAQRSQLFAEGAAAGYLIKKPNGDVWQTDLWQAGMGIVDFTNPGARAWFAQKLRVLIDMGVDSFKTDFGERVPTDVVYHDGSDPEGMHNYFSYLYNKTVFDLLEEAKGQGQAVLFARAATAGGQKFPAHWGGDCESTFEAMAESLRGGLSLSLSGFGFWSHDIGGFEGMPRADVYKRWIAFGLLSPLSRLHGSSSYRVPWLFDQESVDVLRFFTRLKCALMPYVYARAVEASVQAVPMLRAMVMEFPDDPACAYLDRQYMLGGDLLVAPVFSESGEVEYYVPEGTWTKYLSGEVIEGPRWARERHDFLSLPLLVRPNSVIPVGSVEDRPDYDYADKVRLEVFRLQSGSEIAVNIPDTSGEGAALFTVSRSSRRVEIVAEGRSRDWSVLLVGVEDCRALDGATATATDRGIELRPPPGLGSIAIELN